MRKLTEAERRAIEQDPVHGYTMDKVLAKCDEEGECLIWKGSRGRRGEPILRYSKNKACCLRGVVAHLSGHRKAGQPGVWGTKCQTPGCVAPGHLVCRSRGENAKVKVQALPEAVRRLQSVAKARSQARKVPIEDIPLIKGSTEPTSVLMERYGCSKTLINRYRREQHVTLTASPWAGLL